MEQQRQQLLDAPITPLIINKALPSLVGIFSIIFFNLVDTFFVAMLGTDALAGVSFTFPITFAITSVAMGLGIGLSSHVGRLLGAQQKQQAAQLTSHGLLLSLLLVMAIAGLGYVSIYPLFTHLGAELPVMPYIEQYMQIWYLSVPLLVVPMVGNSAIRASGDSKTPSVVMLVAGLVNGILDPILIFGWGPIPTMGVQGAALATAIAWALTFVVALYLLIFRLKLLVFKLCSLRLLISSWQKLLSIALPAVFSQLLTPIATAITLLILASFGTATVAAYGFATRVEALLLIGVMAINSVIPMLVGQNVGAGQADRAQQIVHHGIRLAVIWQLILALLMYLLAPVISHSLNHDAEVAELSQFYLQLVPFCYGMMAVPLLLAQTLNALAKPILAMAINLVRLFGFMLPAIYLGALWGNSKVIFLANIAAHTLAGLASLAILSYLMAQKRWWRSQH
ncbi:MATE family efflux transporter [Agarivorans sp. TSD2052]|uniref:MATE family efflux transporter n=1 Tax=Agarivorans sp. TSD2052 TaxID=2937286 RepID=UPI00200C5C10|nr:MATE family efflux transporter [Agarivorans sp. TSD2052]UPW18620.1 MATE family efflux transporter [Agarivorans sp. TSD2052]